MDSVENKKICFCNMLNPCLGMHKTKSYCYVCSENYKTVSKYGIVFL